MGFCLSCCETNSKSYEDGLSPDAASQREKMAEAAERRIREQERRGIKDVEKVKQLQQRHDEKEKMLEKMPDNEPSLRILHQQKKSDRKNKNRQPSTTCNIFK